MAYSQADLDSIKSGILAIATGERVIAVTVAGRTTQYQAADLATLRDLEAAVAAQVATTNAKPSYVVWATGKGL